VGVFFNSGGVAFYALLAEAFPAELRGRGIGFGVGVGRAGAAFGPAGAGALFAAGFTLPSTAFIMSLGSFVSALILLWLF
ncbi:MFS transporter, partial [Altererythrobacter sp. SALINAS58]|nr:MFS transporter [Alteripontixanthobacter muriae]